MFRHGWSTRYPDSDHAAVQSSKPDPGQAWEFFWQQLHFAARTAAEVPSHALANACHALLSRSRDIAGHDHHHQQQQQQQHRQRARPSFASLSGAILGRARGEASRNEHRRRTKSTGHGQQQVLAGRALVRGNFMPPSILHLPAVAAGTCRAADSAANERCPALSKRRQACCGGKGGDGPLTARLTENS